MRMRGALNARVSSGSKDSVVRRRGADSLADPPGFPRARQKILHYVRPNRSPTNAGVVVLGSCYVSTSDMRAHGAKRAEDALVTSARFLVWCDPNFTPIFEATPHLPLRLANPAAARRCSHAPPPPERGHGGRTLRRGPTGRV